MCLKKIGELIEFIKNPKNLSWVFLLLPIYIFYLSGENVSLIFYIILFFILLAYKYDLSKKSLERIEGRIKQKRKNKPLLRHFKDMWRDANEEFGEYVFAWPFFGLCYLTFFGLYIYSTIIIYSISLILFALNIGLALFWILFALMDNKNLDKFVKGKNEKTRKD
jgi:Flp pilus assembly protein TadB